MKDNFLYIICPSTSRSPLLKKMIDTIVSFVDYKIVDNLNNIPDLRNKKIIFALELSDMGYDINMIEFFSILYKRGNDELLNSVGGVIVHSHSDNYTKRASQDLIYLANNLGCCFIGHPIVEATKTLSNFLTWQKTINIPLEEICLIMCGKLRNRLLDYNPGPISNPKILVLYSRPNKTSNTLDLWHMIAENLKDYDIKELQIENGEVLDCKGCSYKLCTYFASENKCFYGGIMVKEVLPAIEEADAIVWLCPNYNDAIAANLTAVINRLTVLYRKITFYDKSIFSVIVSGNSGSDSISKQLIGALNINKGFRLPPYYSIMATANDPKAIFSVPHIEDEAKIFADKIKVGILK